MANNIFTIYVYNQFKAITKYTEIISVLYDKKVDFASAENSKISLCVTQRARQEMSKLSIKEPFSSSSSSRTARHCSVIIRGKEKSLQKLNVFCFFCFFKKRNKKTEINSTQQAASQTICCCHNHI